MIFKKITLFSIAITLLFAFFSCDKESHEAFPLYDFSCHNIYFEVTDTEGNDLLDPSFSGNLLNQDIVVTYKDKTFNKKKEDAITPRSLPPAFLDIRMFHSEKHNKYHLAFGEFSPESDFVNETFTINWGDETADEIKFDLYITWEKNKKEQIPTVHKKLYVNEKEVDVDDYFIVRLSKKNGNQEPNIIE